MPDAAWQHAANLARWFPDVLLTLGAPDLEERFQPMGHRVHDDAEGRVLEIVLQRCPPPAALVPPMLSQQAWLPPYPLAPPLQAPPPLAAAAGYPGYPGYAGYAGYPTRARPREAVLERLDGLATDFEFLACCLAQVECSSRLGMVPPFQCGSTYSPFGGPPPGSAPPAPPQPPSWAPQGAQGGYAAYAGGAQGAFGYQGLLPGAPGGVGAAAPFPFPCGAWCPTTPSGTSGGFCGPVTAPVEAYAEASSEAACLGFGAPWALAPPPQPAPAQAAPQAPAQPAQAPPQAPPEAAQANLLPSFMARRLAAQAKAQALPQAPAAPEALASAAASSPAPAATEAPAPQKVVPSFMARRLAAQAAGDAASLIEYSPGRGDKQVHQGAARTTPGRSRGAPGTPGKAASWRKDHRINIEITKVQQLDREPASPKMMTAQSKVWGKGKSATRHKTPPQQDRSPIALKERIETKLKQLLGTTSTTGTGFSLPPRDNNLNELKAPMLVQRTGIQSLN